MTPDQGGIVDGLSERARNLALIHLIRRGADSGFAKPDTDQNNRTEKHTTKNG